ncbi:MAG TPA: hypothetical protein VM600_09325, partial [Actinomycetota bacterium]|nr:hypothetical protein [Actinomycetota bacterium]
FDEREYLFAANHGAPLGSLGIFDLSAPLVLELPISPVPAGLGSVGVVAGDVKFGRGTHPFVAVTNTTHALGGCGMPKGTVTIYDAGMLPTLPPQEIDTVELSGGIPYAVALDGARGRFLASSYCGNTLESIGVTGVICDFPPQNALCPRFAARYRGARATGAGPDATVFDQARGLNYTVNITGSSVSVHDSSTPEMLTTVPLANNARPIDATLADGPGGRQWLITSNGGNDSVSIVDRDVIEVCVADARATCPEAEVAQIKTKVPGGSPEGVAYDPATDRVFVVNKGLFAPSLSVIQVAVGDDGTVTGEDIRRIPLGAVGTSTPVPAVIAFDVVVQTDPPVAED